MEALLDILPLLALGFLGSLHCVGMCGGFAVAVSAGERGSWPRLLSGQGLYILGKAASYAVLALLLATGLAWLGGAEGPGHPGFGLARRILSVLAGVVLIATGLAALLGKQLFVGGRAHRVVSAATAPARRLLDGARALPPRSRAFGVGVLNGLLPCGLSWAAVLVAAQEPPHVAALGAFAFGLATAPALIAVGLGTRLVGQRTWRLAPSLLGVVLVVFGVLTVLRGDPAAGLHATHSGPSCCPEAEAVPEPGAAGGH